MSFSKSALVKSISYYGVKNAKFNSLLGSNAALCCKYFGWDFDNFLVGIGKLQNTFFKDHFWENVNKNDKDVSLAVLEFMGLRDGVFEVTFSGN